MALFRRGGKDPAPQDTVETEVDESTVVDDGPDLDAAPEVSVPPVERTGGPWDASQVDDVVDEIRQTIQKGYRTLVTVLTKKMAEDLTEYLN